MQILNGTGLLNNCRSPETFPALETRISCSRSIVNYFSEADLGMLAVA